MDTSQAGIPSQLRHLLQANQASAQQQGLAAAAQQQGMTQWQLLQLQQQQQRSQAAVQMPLGQVSWWFGLIFHWWTRVEIDPIDDALHLCARLRTDGTKANFGWFLNEGGGRPNKWKNLPIQKIVVVLKTIMANYGRKRSLLLLRCNSDRRCLLSK